MCVGLQPLSHVTLNFFFFLGIYTTITHYDISILLCFTLGASREPKRRTRTMELEGSRSYDSLPYEIILCIFSLLPLDCVFRLKCVCKAWSVLISDFGALHLKRLRETSRGIICLNTHRISDNTISFQIRSLQIGGGFKTLITKEISRSTINPIFFRIGSIYSLNGLICLSDGHDFHVCNPTTREFVTLPVCYPSPPDTWRNFKLIGFGYCPLTKQYKVLNIFQDNRGSGQGISELKAAIITVGHSNSWRIVDIPTSYAFFDSTIYFNGTLYWMNNHSLGKYLHITAFDVSEETFQIISLPPKLEDVYSSKCLAEYEGRLCLVDFVPFPEECLEMYTMFENHQWVFRFRVLFEDFQRVDAYDLYPEIVSCLKLGKILVFSSFALKKWYFYDIKSKALEFVDLGSTPPDAWFRGACPYEESFTPICKG